jgi:hypothetical protein
VIIRELDRLHRLVRRNLANLVVGFIFASPAIFLAYAILSGSGEPNLASSGPFPTLALTDTPSTTAVPVPAPGTTLVQRIQVPGPDSTVLTYQTSVAPGKTSLIRETISEIQPGTTSRATETLAGQVVTATVTADGSTVAVPGPITTVIVTETALVETVTVPGPETTVTVTEPPSSD